PFQGRGEEENAAQARGLPSPRRHAAASPPSASQRRSAGPRACWGPPGAPARAGAPDRPRPLGVGARARRRAPGGPSRDRRLAAAGPCACATPPRAPCPSHAPLPHAFVEPLGRLARPGLGDWACYDLRALVLDAGPERWWGLGASLGNA